jgi:hypothetical protein
MLKISDPKTSMVDLRSEEARIKKDLLKVTKQKQKAASIYHLLFHLII